MPDFDVDFDERRRGEVIRYVTEKYGDDRVAQIVTYGTIKAKQAMKDSARVLGYPYALGDQLTKLMPPAIMGKDIPLGGIFDPTHKRYSEAGEFRARYETDPDAKRVVDTARGLENLKRQWGVHAAGVIMSSEPLLDVIPIMKREQDGQIITQFDYPSCEALGLVKMDFLGLRNLTILDDALRNIVANRSQVIDLDALSKDLTDHADLRRCWPAATPSASSSSTAARCARCCGPCGRTTSRTSRPSARSTGRARWAPGRTRSTRCARTARSRSPRSTPSSPRRCEEVLGETYGLIVYQEQVILIAQKLAGYTLGKADLLRKAMGKKKREVLDAEFVGFSEGMAANGYSMAAIKTLWDILVPFSDYAFNKAHTAAYGLVSYWTAYLKANYPAEYMAALLTSVRDDKDKSALYLNECRRMGIKVLPPDVNESDADYTPRGTDIRFGLSAIRNVGENVVASIAATRDGQGPVHRLLRLPAQGRSGGLQQEDRRVADQGRRVRLARRPAPRPAQRARRGHRLVHAHQAQRGARPVRPVRRRRRGRRRVGDHRDAGDPDRGVGQERAARSTSGRCSGSTSPTTRCSASSTCSPRPPTARSRR